MDTHHCNETKRRLEGNRKAPGILGIRRVLDDAVVKPVRERDTKLDSNQSKRSSSDTSTYNTAHKQQADDLSPTMCFRNLRQQDRDGTGHQSDSQTRNESPDKHLC